MLGAITGDIIGSVFEWDNHKSTEFPLFGKRCTFTDDSVLTIAVADAILNKRDYADALRDWARRYPDRGYGGNFGVWAFQKQDTQPYNSWGNGSAMRVSPVGFAYDTLEETLAEAQRSADVTHNHPEGIKGAQSTAAAIFLARQKKSKEEIKGYIAGKFGYDLEQTLDEIRPGYNFDVSCMGTMPVALLAFLESNDFEHAIRLAVSVGGDTDTICCITGGIAEAFYGGVPQEIAKETMVRLPEDMLDIIDNFFNHIKPCL